MTKIPKNTLRALLCVLQRRRYGSTKTQSSSPQVEANISEFQEDWVLLGTPEWANLFSQDQKFEIAPRDKQKQIKFLSIINNRMGTLS